MLGRLELIMPPIAEPWHDWRPEPEWALPELPKGWEPTDEIINEFRLFLEAQKATFAPADFAANRDWVKKELKREMYITAFSQDESQRVAIEQDPEVLKAIDSMPKAKALVDNAKKLLVQRMTGQDPRAAVR